MITLVSLLLILLNGFYDSIIDTVHHHWGVSVFRDIKNRRLFKFFHKDGWKNKYVDGVRPLVRKKFSIDGVRFNVPVQITDAFHFFKMLRITNYAIITFINSISTDHPDFVIWVQNEYGVHPFLSIFVVISVGFILRNKVFLLFYNKVWIRG